MRVAWAVCGALAVAVFTYAAIYVTLDSKFEHFRDEIERNELRKRTAANKRLKPLQMIVRQARQMHSPSSKLILPPKIDDSTTPSSSFYSSSTPPASRSEGITVVTALLDIGRGNWTYYRRPFQYYLEFMENLLNLDVNMVIFVDAKGEQFVRKHRDKFPDSTRVFVTEVQQLPLWVAHDLMQNVLNNEKRNWNSGWEQSMKIHPESFSAEYCILMNSKAYFLYRVATDNPFNSEFFCWLDAGYGHGKAEYFPARGRWEPSSLPSGKITLIELYEKHDFGAITLEELYRQDVSHISGGFLAGDKAVVIEFYRIYEPFVYQLAQKGYVDDDQTIMTLVIKNYRHLFHTVVGSWFDAFRLFP